MSGRFCLLLLCLIILSNGNECAGAVRIAILDSGCNIGYAEGISFVDDTIADQNGHGTTIAKIIKESNPAAELYIAKVLARSVNNIDTEPFVKGIQWAISRQVDVINMSWQVYRDDEAIHDAIKEAYRRGIIIVAAAGNKSGIVDALVNELQKRSAAENTGTGVKYPARYEEVIAIGAIGSFLGFSRHETYSPAGREIEFVCDGSYGSEKGTSFACARATGIISRIKADYPNLDGTELRKNLRFYASDLWNEGRDTKSGYGKLEYKPLASIQ